jgi:aryl-alcohol dehydrogenase-like predicted oxidoreductase
MFAWQFSQALYTARLNGWTEFVSMQNHVNLLYREEEREMLPLCEDHGIAVIPWSPLARGRLTRPWTQSSVRQDGDAFGSSLDGDAESAIVEQVARIAAERGVPMAQVAMAWLLGKPGITGAIVGATKPQHIDDAVAALTVSLDMEEVAALEAPYRPRAIAGHGPDMARILAQAARPTA